MGNENNIPSLGSNEWVCSAKNAYRSLNVFEGWDEWYKMVMNTLSSSIPFLHLSIPPLMKIIKVLDLKENNVKNTQQFITEAAASATLLTIADYLRGVVYNSASDETKKVMRSWVPDFTEGFLGLTYIYWNFKDHTDDYTFHSFHPNNWSFLRENNGKMMYTYLSSQASSLYFKSIPILLQTAPIALSFALHKANKFLYLLAMELTQEQMWIYNKISCDFNSNRHFKNPLGEKELGYLARFIQKNIQDDTSPLIKSFEQAISQSNFDKLDWLVTTITYLAQSKFPSKETKQFFDAVLSIKQHNKELDFNKGDNMPNLLETMEKLFKLIASPEERENYLKSFHIITERELASMKSILDFAQTSGLSKEERKQFLDAVVAIKQHNKELDFTHQSLNELKIIFPYINYDAGTASLLADYITIKQQQKQEYSLSKDDFKITAQKNYSANKQQVIKEVVTSLEPINQKLVEFCAFYAPYNLDEKALRDFLNKNNDYSPAKFGIDKLNLHKALTGQNLALLQDLQQFFIEENKAKFNGNAAVYINSVMSEINNYIKQEDAEITQQIKSNIKETNKDYLYRLSYYEETNPAKMESFYLGNDFAFKTDLWDKKLFNSININYLSQLKEFLPLWLNGSSIDDSIAAYNSAIELMYPHIFLPFMPDAIEKYYLAIFDGTYKYTTKPLNEMANYIVKQSTDVASDFWKKHDLYKPEILMIPYWLNSMQLEKFNYMHNYLQQNMEYLKEPLLYEITAYFYADTGRDKVREKPSTDVATLNIIDNYIEIYFPELAKNSKYHPYYSVGLFEQLGNSYKTTFAGLLPANFTHQLEKAVMSTYSALNSATTLLLQLAHYQASKTKKLQKDITAASSTGGDVKQFIGVYYKQLDGLLAMEWLLLKTIPPYKLCQADNGSAKVEYTINCELNNFHYYSLLYSSKLALNEIANTHPSIDKDKYKFSINEQLSTLIDAHHSLLKIKSSYDNPKSAFLSYVDHLILGNKLNIIHAKQSHGIDLRDDCQFFAIQLGKDFINPLNTEIVNLFQQICNDYTENDQPFASESQSTMHDEL